MSLGKSANANFLEALRPLKPPRKELCLEKEGISVMSCGPSGCGGCGESGSEKSNDSEDSCAAKSVLEGNTGGQAAGRLRDIDGN